MSNRRWMRLCTSSAVLISCTCTNQRKRMSQLVTYSIILFQMKAGWQLPVFLALMAILNSCGFYATLPSSWQHSLAKFGIWQPLLPIPSLSVHIQCCVSSESCLLLTRNCWGWKIPPGALSQTIDPALPAPPQNHVLKCHIHTFLGHFQGQWFHHFPGYSIPMLDNPSSEFFFFLISNLNFLWCNLEPFLLALLPIPLVLSMFQSLQLWGWDIHGRHIPAQSWGPHWAWMESALRDPKFRIPGKDRARTKQSKNCL